MKNNITELVFILDKSGSMSGLESDTIGGFNSMLEKQKAEEGTAYISTVLFNQASSVLHDRLPIDKVEKLTRKDYMVGGSTALIDALGDAIHHIGNIHKYARPEDVPAHTIFVIITDGMENASHRYSSQDVKASIKARTEENGWEFLFLGANIDAVETAARYGIAPDRAVEYRSDKRGTSLNYETVSAAISDVRVCGKMKASWAAPIAEYAAGKADPDDKDTPETDKTGAHKKGFPFFKK
ncbi:MAG: VWA domain-containing protein [Clostridia bacterium]|nr:VWA domain-containing protein [Clostridia bacterium]